jgi:hypothetical protein
MPGLGILSALSLNKGHADCCNVLPSTNEAQMLEQDAVWEFPIMPCSTMNPVPQARRTMLRVSPKEKRRK